MTNEQTGRDEAGAFDALNSIRDVRAQTLDKMNYWPWWYDGGYALSCALLVGGQGFKAPFSLMSTTVAIAILVLIMRKWQAKTGVWVNGYSPKRARWAAFALAGILLVLMGASIWFGRIQGLVWVPLATGAVSAVLGLMGMRVWMQLYRKDVADLT